jgi:hypothetical protein
MLAAVMCLLVIVALTAVAVQQSVGTLSGFAQGRKLLQTVDAAQAGIETEIAAIQHWLASPSATLPCPVGSTTIAGLPTGQGWVPAGAGSADSVVNGASLGYYTLSMATYTTEPSPPSGELPESDACYNNSISSPTTSPWYAIVQAKGITSATTGGSTATGRTLQALIQVNNYSGVAYHRHGRPNSRSRPRIELVRFYSSGSTTYTSNASAQVFNVSQLVTLVSPAPQTPAATTASYSGYGSPDPSVISSGQPSASILTGESWLTAGALAQYAEADSSGTSESCAGLVASPGSIQAGSSSCSPSGSPSATGVTLDLSTIPAVGTAISSLADVTLETSAISSSASMGTNGSPVSGTASLGNLYVRVAVPLGNTVTIPVPVATGANQDLMGEVTNAINGDASAIGSVTPTLISTLESELALTSNYQTTLQTSSGPEFEVSAIHISVLTNAATGDIALSTVGPNTAVPSSSGSGGGGTSGGGTSGGGGSTTTTTTVPSTTTTTSPSGTTTTVPSTTTTVPLNNLTIVWVRQVG